MPLYFTIVFKCEQFAKSHVFFIFQVNCVDDKYYNILSIDGGGIRGLIPATILEKIEEAAYDYAISKSYDITSMSYPAVHQSYNKIAMKDLFDMSAGTSTGSIIAASLSMPANETDGSLSKTTPKFWAKDIIDIYRNDNDKIFDKNQFSTIWLVLINFFTAPLFIYAGYVYGIKKFDNAKKIK